ncbi:MAG: tRNA (adenosine(37)-N6)-threonylcarbamoyltransferase complex ATPase subunit type 1 TsaE [Bacteroidota bacterium]
MKPEVITINYNVEDINAVALRILKKVSSKVILFKGEMGAGKTTFIKSLIKNMGSQDEVGSPTFSLVNEYITKEGKVYHFDLYRIKNQDELYGIGLEDYLNQDAWILIEWPEKASEFLPRNVNSLILKTIDKNIRSLELNLNPNIN